MIAQTHSSVSLALLVPFVFIAFGAIACVIVVMIKWSLVGRFTIGKHTLYSLHVWRTELIERLEEGIAEPMLMLGAAGTSLSAWWFAAMGATVGKRPFLNHCIITEPDMVTVGDFTTVDAGATLQAHLFQDRVRTIDRVHIGAHCNVGCNSVILLGSQVCDYASLSSMSLLMQQEFIPAGEWHGTPIQPVVKTHKTVEVVTGK